MKNKISIISTFYNAEQYLDQSIQSVLKQTCQNINIEYILINDCSTDNSLDVAKEKIKDFEKENFSVSILTTENNLGCGGARKFGIEHATGDYFMFLDADDYYISPTFVSRAYKDITFNKADIVEYGVLYNELKRPLLKDGKEKVLNLYKERYELYKEAADKIVINNGEEGVYNIFKDNKIKFNVWSKIYTRAIVESYPYSDTRTYEDIRTIPIWVKNANKIVIMPNVEINYRASSNSIIREDGLKTRIGTITAMTEMCEVFKNNRHIIKALYGRAMIDLCAVLENKTSDDPGFNELSKLNTKLLSYIYPDNYKEITFNLDD